MKLFCKTIDNAKPRPKAYKLADGGGLYLLVKPDGKKYWRLKFSYAGKENTLAVGVYPLVTLAEAREARDHAKKLLAKGINPNQAKRENRQKIVRNAQNTFKAVALEWHEAQKENWSEKHAQNIMRRLEKDIFPYIGNRPIADIDAVELLNVLKKIEERDALDIAGRVRSLCGRIFRYGIITGRCKENPTTHLQGAIKTRKTTHFAAIEKKELPELLKTIDRNEARLYSRTKRALLLSLLTFLRPGEIRQARWEEIDLKAQQWVIPADRMKMGRDHIIPLSRQAVAVLKEQAKETGHLNTPWVFPNHHYPRKPMSDGAVLVALKRLGYEGRMSAHGFRALARTAIREDLGWDSDVIEVQLAHKPSGPLGAAYDRTQFIDHRRIMMQEWADYIDTARDHGKVIVANFKQNRRSGT